MVRQGRQQVDSRSALLARAPQRFAIKRHGGFAKPRSCKRRVLFRAKGTRRWKFKKRVHLTRGRYRVVATARDRAGNTEKPKRHRNTITFRVR